MKRLTYFLLAFSSFAASAQTLAEFSALAQKKDTLAQQALLKKWEKSGTADPDFYVAAFNYYASHGRREVLSVQTVEPEGESLQFTDSIGNTAGYIGSTVYYDAGDTKKALDYINKGIVKFPDRLDLRFGKTYLLGEAEDWKLFTNEILAAVDHSSKISNKWKWKGNEPLEDAKNFMLGSIQAYVMQLYNTQDDSLLPNMAQIAERVLKYYPDHVESLSNLSIVYMLQNQPDKALPPLLKAEKIDPKDTIVLGNIAHCYKMKNDTPNAIKYYELVLQYGDADSKQFATDQLEKLKGK
jgi:tetratricopeptide (TPR) repeat protein